MLKDEVTVRELYQPLILADIYISGNESMLDDIMGGFKSVGGKIADGASEVGGKLADGAVKVFNNAATGLIKVVGTRKAFHAHLLKRLEKDELKPEIEFSKTILSKISQDGKVSSLVKTVEDLDSTIRVVLSYSKELDTYIRKELDIFKSIKDVKTDDDLRGIIKELTNLKYPSLDFKHKRNSMSESSLLPGGVVLTFHDNEQKAKLLNADVTITEVTESFDKDELKSLLNKLITLFPHYHALADVNTKYSGFIKQFNTVVKESFAHLQSVKGDLSTSMVNDLQSRLEGNHKAFGYFTGFLPKVVILLDDYVDDVTSFFSKQFN